MAPPAPVWQRLIFGLILAWWTHAALAIQPVPVAENLAVDSPTARDGKVPIVVLFSRAHCGWCDKARREHLDAMATHSAGGALFRQIDVDSDAWLIDFSGQRTRHRTFARKHGAKMTPTLMFFGPDGQALADPIVGYRLPEFYGTLIEDAIEDSRNRLRSEDK